MLKIKVQPGEKIERALKRYKRKRKKTQLMKRIRDKKHFEKDSITRRKELEKARYKEKYLNEISEE